VPALLAEIRGGFDRGPSSGLQAVLRKYSVQAGQSYRNPQKCGKNAESHTAAPSQDECARTFSHIAEMSNRAS
jgi:hypothetical protein